MNTTSPTINLGTVEKIPLGQGRCFNVSGQEIAVFRQRDGTLFATQNACPHRQGPLAEGIVGGGKVICPLHAHKFDLATGTGSEPSECVKTYAVSQVNGDILLQVGPANPTA
jgi:nitrite reductase (NADH) small subunit